MIQKEVMMVHSLQLLGFQPIDSSTSVASRVTSKTSSTVLHPQMFDRPNEKVLFQILHFLVIKINPQTEQELRFCWPPITPHDKSNFKRIVQTVLYDLEKRKILPLGSSQVSRINSGSGPRIVDLVWRLSTHAIKTLLTRDHSSYDLVPPPSTTEGYDKQDVILLLKAKIAMKTRQFKEQCVTQSQVQSEWQAFALSLTRKIQEITSLQQQIYDQQGALDRSVNREIFSQAETIKRAAQIEQINKSWDTVCMIVDSDEYQADKKILKTAQTHHLNQPILSASDLKHHLRGTLNLTDIIKNADGLMQLTRRQLLQQNTQTTHLSDSDMDRMKLLVNETAAHNASLTTIVQHLRQLLNQLKQVNTAAARDLYIELAANASMDDDDPVLCPPTPADQQLDESDLIQSLKKCSINELSSAAANSIRNSAQKEQHQYDHNCNKELSSSSIDLPMSEAQPITRKLHFHDTEEDTNEHMEI